ncbi:zinc finger C2HC5-type motif containing protein [Nitzschia inconspicua]|uniref:Zinc finger C2HC5-type motif containing protein n=1 Tax=Nitzschia inconspicua TaxID=303405 RepID=A0A9K3L160_9STRA|nr:zinc finger C2HC5-type motif containing protein [Nitzschia inconspicua]
MTSDRSILQATLAKLLGFDDGAEDILGHLLTIDSKADLSEYLSQLLGKSSRELEEFVENICRYQKGEPLLVDDSLQEPSKTVEKAIQDVQSKPSSLPKQQNSKASTAIESRRKKQNQIKKSRVPPAKINSSNNETKSASSSMSVGNDSGKKDTASKETRNVEIDNNTLSASDRAIDSTSTTTSQPAEQDRVMLKSHPKRGRASKVCGCFGTKHKPLTNCLYCGRIACQLEGYDFCAFCGYMVEEIKSEANNKDKAWLQKERLLRFDREFARRTQIFDDQADYQQHTSWLTEEERKEAENQEEERRQSLRRPKQMMNLAM